MKKLITTTLALTLFATLTQTASAKPPLHVPDAGTSSALLVLAFAGLSAVRRYVR